MSSDSSDTRDIRDPHATPLPNGGVETQAGAATPSSWWTAPAGRPLPIPAFARGFLEVLLDLLMPRPAPVPVPVKVRAGTRRR